MPSGFGRGAPHGNATLEAIFANANATARLRHVLALRAEQQNFRIEDERIENEAPYEKKNNPYFHYGYKHGQPVIKTGKGVRKLRL